MKMNKSFLSLFFILSLSIAAIGSSPKSKTNPTKTSKTTTDTNQVEKKIQILTSEGTLEEF